jgi:hypothetical protein
MEQLHRYVLTVKSRSASNRIAPQWQLRYVFNIHQLLGQIAVFVFRDRVLLADADCGAVGGSVLFLSRCQRFARAD